MKGPFRDNCLRYYYLRLVFLMPGWVESKESCLSNVFTNPELNIINPSSEVPDLDVYMSSNCTFDFHVTDLYKICSNLSR